MPDRLSFASEKIILDILQKLDFEIISVGKYSYLPHDAKSILKELVKAILPEYKSQFYYYLKPKLYSHTDLYVRARLRS